MKKILSLLIIIATFISCKREVVPVDEVAMGKEYFPLTMGHFIEYEVDSLYYNDFTKDTFSKFHQYRDEIVDSFEDNQGRMSYNILRSIRDSIQQPWQILYTYYATPEARNLQVVEDNLRFIKLVFPVKDDISWKGNLYIPASTSGLDELKWYDDWDYTYSSTGKSFHDGTNSFSNCTQIKYSNLINDSTSVDYYSEFTDYHEVYSKNIGLVYRRMTHWEYQPTKHFRSGFSCVMRAINHN